MPGQSVLRAGSARPIYALRFVQLGYDWLTRTSRAETPEMRAWMLATVTYQTIPVLIGSVAIAATSLAVIALTGARWPLYWMALELVIASVRIYLLRHLNSRAIPQESQEPYHAGLIACGLLWSAAFGAGAFACIQSGEPAIMVLGGVNVAGMTGISATRNCATPRYATAAMILVAVPFVLGAETSGTYGMLTVAVIVSLLLAGMISMLLQNNRLLARTYRAEQRAHRLSTTDSLSGLCNRKSLQDALRSLTRDWRAGKSGQYSFLYLDLDGFKEVNDQHGHRAGDLLLSAVAKRLRASAREADAIFRPGGDEFVMILPGSDAPAAGALARRIIAACGEPFEIGLGQPVSIGISIGGASSGPAGPSPTEAVAAADRALYVAKRAGKGVYCDGSPVLQRGMMAPAG